ncbi:MAG: bifunctional metallophosphatase/5'-nucleotidase [bacterium]
MKPFALLIAGLVASCSASPTKPEPPAELPKDGPVHVKIIGINDFHGNLEGPSGKVTVGEDVIEAGGVDYLAARIHEISKYNPNFVVVGAGDMVGASPLISSLFHDEPAIETLNEAGLAITAVGNHEFDEGVDELLRLKKGGCHPTDGCQDGDGFEGAKFEFLAANVTYKTDGETIFPAAVVREFEGVPVGFIGLTLEGTPQIVDPSGITSVDFADEAQTINANVETLKAQGISAIVVLIHEGGLQSTRNTPDGCEGISGPILEIVQNTSKDVDVFVTGHTHQAYNCTIDGRLVTSAKSYGQMLTEIDLTLDRTTGDVTEASAKNLVVDRTGEPMASVTAIVDKYRAIVEPLANRRIGEIKGDLLRESGESGDSVLGRVIADSQLWATKASDKGGAQIAFMNPGGVRGDIAFASANTDGPGVVTYAEAHTVQPFGNSLVTMTLTGAQIHQLLECQFDGDRPSIMHPSQGFTYTWSQSAERGKKVDPKTITLAGKTLDPATGYRVTVNSFVAAGGGGCDAWAQGTDRVGGPLDLDAFVNYLGEYSPLEPPTTSRITLIP